MNAWLRAHLRYCLILIMYLVFGKIHNCMEFSYSLKYLLLLIVQALSQRKLVKEKKILMFFKDCLPVYVKL